MNPEVVLPRVGLYYSRYEFMFLNGCLESIQNDQFDPDYPDLMEYENEVFKVDTEFMKADAPKCRKDIEAYLQEYNIEYQPVAYWGREALQTSSGVVLDFADDQWSDEKETWVTIHPKEDHPFLGIRYFPKQTLNG